MNNFGVFLYPRSISCQLGRANSVFRDLLTVGASQESNPVISQSLKPTTMGHIVKKLFI